MILLGFLTLLFVVYQLWGTGLLTERYQQGLENDFEELVEQVEEVAAVTAVVGEARDNAAVEQHERRADHPQKKDMRVGRIG